MGGRRECAGVLGGVEEELNLGKGSFLRAEKIFDGGGCLLFGEVDQGLDKVALHVDLSSVDFLDHNHSASCRNGGYRVLLAGIG